MFINLLSLEIYADIGSSADIFTACKITEMKFCSIFSSFCDVSSKSLHDVDFSLIS